MDLLIKGLSSEDLAALATKAQAAGMDRMNYCREQLARLAQEPLIRERYAIRFMDDGGFACGTIRRFSNDLNGVSSPFGGCSESQAAAVRMAAEFVRQNGQGDRERAITLLSAHFEQVNEIA